MALLAFLRRKAARKPATAAPPSAPRCPRDHFELDDLIRHCIKRAVPDLQTRVMATTAADLLRSVLSEHPTAVREALVG